MISSLAGEGGRALSLLPNIVISIRNFSIQLLISFSPHNPAVSLTQTAVITDEVKTRKAERELDSKSAKKDPS